MLSLVCVTAPGLGTARASPPVMATVFSVHVSLVENDGPQEYTWSYDWKDQRERVDWTLPSVLTSIRLYHGNETSGCMDNNTCASVYTWGPATDCSATETADTMVRFWGWLTDDQFTHERATYIRHDSIAGCDLWQHNSRPFYPGYFNQTACVSHSQRTPMPVYMHWVELGANATGYENKSFSSFSALDGFPAATFEPRQDCPPSPTVASKLMRGS